MDRGGGCRWSVWAPQTLMAGVPQADQPRPTVLARWVHSTNSSSDKLIHLFMVRKSGSKVTFISAYMCVFL